MFIDTAAANAGSKAKVARAPQSTTRDSEETTPLLETFVGQDPPPTYLEATTPNPWNGRPSGDEATRLLSFDGRGTPVPLLARSSDGMYKGGAYQRRSLREHCSRRRMIKYIAAKIVSPIPALPSQPQEGYPIRWPSNCKKDYNTNTAEFNFGMPPELRIQEAVHQLDGPYKRVSGWIHVVRAPADQPAGTVQAKLAYAVSQSVDIDSIKYASTETGLTIGDPVVPDVGDSVKPGTACLGISVVVYIAPGAKLENFNVASVHLGMQIHQGVDFSVINATSISLTTGTLDAPPFNSRETRLETISGSISGKYALLDLLSIKTKSGSVNVNVAPKKAGKEGSEPAIFLASSLSGSIRADFERKKIPDRDYQVSIDTKVGSVDGTFIHGSTTVIQSIAGFITADILPFEAGSYASTIETSTSSGQTKLKIRPPYVNPGTALNKLTSTHKSISGAMDLTYPQEWEGHLEGSTLNGSLHLEGRDLELIHQGEDVPGGSRVEAKKGGGGSNMLFKTVSGSCEVKVGNL
ncbi:uncharacterized protein BDR25DRAFT_330944 [Lindgomyces ingoldianus]|uniref:Uncharacterized protein n=1 Tax=Lindgomyces ingoldianus TaxID=673940 RepID=A0ACB6RE47_9PLEO|nr:uncharacterized protein BDR25DRAFT_330944 [Lindgomyces ingoldianus]KAF2477023.1 hypothetical protein BDR25DRAFT_330944 [Lindgomyces ingoldianus]